MAISSTRAPARPCLANSSRAAVSSFLRVATGSRRCGTVSPDRFADISNQTVDKSGTGLLHWYPHKGRATSRVAGNGRDAMKHLQAAIVTLMLGLPAVPANAGEAVNLILNWTPTAD